jgi:hypothetical protein
MLFKYIMIGADGRLACMATTGLDKRTCEPKGTHSEQR